MREARRQDGIRDRRGQRHRVRARPGLCAGRHEGDARRYRGGCAGGRGQKPARCRARCARRALRRRRSRQRRAAAKASFEAFGNVHVVCNNAGVAAGGGIDNISLDNWRWVLDVNLMGVLHGIRSFPAAHPRPRRGRPHRQHRVDGRDERRARALAPIRRANSRWSAMSEGLAAQLKPHRHRRQRALSELRPHPHRRERAQPAAALRPVAGAGSRQPGRRDGGRDRRQLCRPGSTRPRSRRGCSPRSGRTNSTSSPIRDMRNEVDERFAAIQAAMDRKPVA